MGSAKVYKGGTGMVSQELSPVEKILELIKERRHFVLQGGAGSGKTESLKQVVHALAETNPTLKIACITHTNKAADQIQGRVQAGISVSTIHSFLGSLIKPYGRNIKCVFSKLFLLPVFEIYDLKHYNDDNKERRLKEHARFKKAHAKLAARRNIILHKSTDKVTGKLAYDKNPEHFNVALNSLIEEVNKAIDGQVALKKVEDFSYNETKFNNFQPPSFGHDGLLAITTHLFDLYPVLGKIIADRYDCIFIDEYQDANADIIRVLLKNPATEQLVIGLFGDSEQAIYEEGIGSAWSHVDNGTISLVEKNDNYRCSPQVIKVANKFRTDGLTQEIALKELKDGTLESVESREGSAVFYYAIAPTIENTGDEKVDKKNHKQAVEDARDALVKKAVQLNPVYVQLKLTNKSIAQDIGFERLYNIFASRYVDPRDRMKKTLDRLQFGEVAELIGLHQSVSGDKRAYNRLISKLQKQNRFIRSVKDKKVLESLLMSLGSMDQGAYATILFAMNQGLIKCSDSHKTLLERYWIARDRLDQDGFLKEFERLQVEGANTLPRMKKALPDSDSKFLDQKTLDERFEEMARDLLEKKFLEAFFSCDLTFSEVIAFYNYEDEDSDALFTTMHKTKGTGIDDVMVVLHEYGWLQKYNFKSCFSGMPPVTQKETSTRKLLYVACSRTIKNLVCVRLVRDKIEADKIGNFFPQVKLIELN